MTRERKIAIEAIRLIAHLFVTMYNKSFKVLQTIRLGKGENHNAKDHDSR
ncbi:hypothetical protein AGMMS49983_20010 [Clostridia bacterium]|nr:hypothetical protein AGMMS49983_20010 [Clostridia bacterium]